MSEHYLHSEWQKIEHTQWAHAVTCSDRINLNLYYICTRFKMLKVGHGAGRC